MGGARLLRQVPLGLGPMGVWRGTQVTLCPRTVILSKFQFLFIPLFSPTPHMYIHTHMHIRVCTYMCTHTQGMHTHIHIYSSQRGGLFP